MALLEEAFGFSVGCVEILRPSVPWQKRVASLGKSFTTEKHGVAEEPEGRRRGCGHRYRQSGRRFHGKGLPTDPSLPVAFRPSPCSGQSNPEPGLSRHVIAEMAAEARRWPPGPLFGAQRLPPHCPPPFLPQSSWAVWVGQPGRKPNAPRVWGAGRRRDRKRPRP